MTPISADDLMFDEDGPVGAMGAVSADDLQFDTPAPKIGKKKPAQPKLKPLGELRKQAKEFTTEPSKGIPIIAPRKPTLDLVKARKQAKGFTATPEQEGVVVGQDNSAPTGLRIAGIKRRDGETLDSFLAREKVWREQEYQRESGERAQRAAMRAELTPKGGAVRNWIEQEVPLGAAVMGLGEGLDLGSLGQGVTAIENAVSGFGQGVGESIRTMGIGASLVTGTEPDSLALQPRMPTMNPADSASWAGKLGQGGGSMAMFMLASPLLGPTGATLLGAAQNAGQTYEEARARGVSHDEALAAAVPGALIGALEGIGGAGGAARGFIKGTLGEMGQEGMSQALNNINAKILSGYDPKRAITEGVFESAVLGGLLGAGVHGVANINELTQLPSQIDSKLRELGIEQSFGSLPDEGKQAGVELYAGLDPKLIRDFLPRPETIRSLFNSLFKGVKSTDQDIDAQLESSKTRLFAQIESRKQALMQKAPSYPDIYEATPEQLDEVLDVPELKWVWSDVIPIAPLSDPKIQKLYKQSYNFNQNGSYSIDITYVPTGEIINTVPFGPGMSDANKQAALVAARDSWQRQMRGDSDYSPELVEMLDETYEELKQSKKLRYQKEVEKDLRSTEKHVRRWLDKQKWELQRKKQKEVGPGIESRTGAEPQGIVVHKISAQNLNRLLQEAENDITKAQQPMPSIGVIHPETDFDSFGGIQLIATPSLVEDAVKAGLAYPTDFYTPTAADAMYKMGEYSITPSNVQKIVDQMIRETKDYGDRRLSEAQAVFENAAIFNSYAKAGGAFESMDAVKEGLGALKPGAKTKSMTPEFAETREVQREFNSGRDRLHLALEELGIDSTEIDQYLLAQLSKPSLPSSDQIAIGLKKLLKQRGISEAVIDAEGEIVGYEMHDKWSQRPYGKGNTIEEVKKAALEYLTSPIWGLSEAEVKKQFNEGHLFIRDVVSPGLGTTIKDLADKAATAFYTFRQAPTIYMEAQPPRGVRLDEYVAALVPTTVAPSGWGFAGDGSDSQLDFVANTLARQGVKVYRYGSPEEKVAIQKALAQFKDVVVNPASSYGALYSNPVFDPEAWKRAKEAWVPGQPDPEQELLARAEHVPEPEKTREVTEGETGVPGAEGKIDGVFEEPTRDYGELDADDLEWDDADVVDPVEQQLRDVYEKATQQVPPTPPTAPTPTDAGRPGSPLTETVVAKDRYAQLREKLMQAAVAKGYKWDLSIPPGLQLARAIKAGYLEMDNMTEVLAQAGMTVSDLADLAEFTQHRAGQILNELSKITKELDDLISTNPQLASLIIGPNKVMQRGLKKLEATELGHSIWERAGSIMRKNFLSRLSTAFVQVWSTTAQVPLDIASGAIAGLGMRFLNPAKWQHNTTGMLATAKEDVVRGIEPVLALARGMNPAQITDLLRWQKPAKQMEYKKIVDDLSLIYPEIYGKLHGREDIVPGSEGYTSPAALRQVLTQVKDPALRREYEVKLRTLEGREKFNKSLRGKVLKGYENALDIILMPLSIQEYAFRRPMFVGALQRELEARGLDLNDFIANPQKVAGARDMLQAAVDEALRFTWAYEPKAGNKAVGQAEQALEGAAHYFVKFWNKLGPVGATLEAFPRALTNGLKFAYEWSPLGILSPAWQAQDKMRHGARDQVTFQEAQRMAQGVVGTMMYGIALGLREWAGGEEWWQLKTGKKNKDGKPIYYDARRIPQLAFFLNAADLAKRASEDTLGDIKVQQRLTDTYLGARRNSQPGDLGAIDQFMLMWTGDAIPTNAAQKSKLAAGQWASTFVIPLSNIRDAWAQFSVQEGAKRDLRESPWLGPSLDKLPWLRRDLPLAEGPFEQSPQLGAYAPLAEGEGLGPVTGAFALGGAIGATRMTPGQSFAAREFARLGLSPYTWLKRNPDPLIDRGQWKAMTAMLAEIGAELESDAGYRGETPDEQRAIWEVILTNAAAQAKKLGELENPEAVQRNKQLQAVPKYRRQAIGLDKLIPPVGQP